MVNWEIGDTTHTDASVNDGQNVIRFDTKDQLPDGVLGRCLVWGFVCGVPEVEAVIELDLIIDDDVNWHFGSTDPSPGQYDFETVVLHELGHGHQLGHVVDSVDVMYYGLAPGQLKRTLSANDKFGADVVQAQGSFSGVCSFEPITNADCNTTSTRELNHTSLVSVYPNPASTVVRVASDVRPDYLILHSIDGKKIWANNEPDQNTEVDVALLPVGIYVLTASVNKYISHHKIVINP